MFENKHSPLGYLVIWLWWLLALLAGCDKPIPSALAPPPLAKELIFYNWESDVPESVLEAFTREFGVKVKYLSYESQEEAITKLRAGELFDLVVVESRDIPKLVREGLVTALNHANLPNLKNIAPNFRDLIYDPSNRYCVPFNWGTAGLVVREDLVAEPVTRWSDLWDPRYAGRVGLWLGQRREVIALTLKSLGFSANSEEPPQLEAALQRLLELKPRVAKLEEIDPETSAEALGSGTVVLAMGYAKDVLTARDNNTPIGYVLPLEGALLWGDTFVIPSKSGNQYTAEVFINFLLRGDINAQIANANRYATPNEAAVRYIQPDILKDSVIYPPNRDIRKAEIVLPLSPEGEQRYADLWERFMAAEPKGTP